jgi:hypothetical protein
VFEIVTKIESLLTETVSMQKDYVERVCAACETSCCLRVHYLFNEKDIFFLRLSGRELSWRRELLTKKGCWFLGEQGCILDPGYRPFICHTYICHDLEMEMNRCDPGLMAVLDEKFKIIGRMRSLLREEYLLAKNAGA